MSISSGPRHRAVGATGDAVGESALRIAWLCPDLLSTYGDRGNMLILARRAYVRGFPVETLEVRSDEAGVPFEPPPSPDPLAEWLELMEVVQMLCPVWPVRDQPMQGRDWRL